MRLLSRIKESFQPPHRFVEYGWVWCPEKGNTNVSECLSCSSLIDHDLTGDDKWVACKAITQPVTPLPGLFVPRS